MELTLKGKRISPINILIDFFASLYDLVYDFMHHLIPFFASLYDLVYDFMCLVIPFFASLYDLVDDFRIFLGEYVKWIINTPSTNSIDFSTNAEEQIQINS
jgi:hypothetical protein